MRYFYELTISFLDELGAGLSFAAFATFVAFQFGGSERLMLWIQYLFIVDFFLGILDATKAKKFSWSRAWEGMKRIVSLYFSVLVVGFGTAAFDVTIKERIEITYNGAFIFDIFICGLIVFQLASINRHLAHFGFGVNQHLDAFVHKFKRKATAKVEDMLNNALNTKKEKEEDTK